MTAPVPSYYGSTPVSADEQNLRLLSIFHYVVAGITALFGCFPFIHLAIGIALLAGAFPPDASGEAPPRFIGVIFIGMASLFIVGFWTLAVLLLFVGRNLGRRRHYTFCFVMACIECAFMPFGTVLGVFSIIVLMRPSVKQLFDLPATGVSPT